MGLCEECQHYLKVSFIDEEGKIKSTQIKCSAFDSPFDDDQNHNGDQGPRFSECTGFESKSIKLNAEVIEKRIKSIEDEVLELQKFMLSQ